MFKLVFLFCIISLVVGEKIAGQYNIFFSDSVSREERDAHFRERSANVVRTYENLHGFTAQLSESEVLEYLDDPGVSLVEADQMVELTSVQFQNHGKNCEVQRNAVWNLGRTAERAPLSNGRYRHSRIGGQGTVIYVVDTGVYCDHSEFQTGKCSFGFKTNDTWTDGDWLGHGTHVASTAVGNILGVAKAGSVISVKAFGGAITPVSDVIAGIDWIIGHQTTKKKIINLSLGSPFEVSLNEACNKAAGLGIVVVTSAGNLAQNACEYSPGSAKGVITVGATGLNTTNDPEFDYRADFSNFGPCVDIMAPGENIIGAFIRSQFDAISISGTSMASPYVAGLSAIHLSEGVPSHQIKTTLICQGTKSIIDMQCDGICSQTPNVMAFKACDGFPMVCNPW